MDNSIGAHHHFCHTFAVILKKWITPSVSRFIVVTGLRYYLYVFNLVFKHILSYHGCQHFLDNSIGGPHRVSQTMAPSLMRVTKQHMKINDILTFWIFWFQLVSMVPSHTVFLTNFIGVSLRFCHCSTVILTFLKFSVQHH